MFESVQTTCSDQFEPVWTSFIPMWLYKSFNFGQRGFQWMTWEIKWDKKVTIFSDFSDFLDFGFEMNFEWTYDPTNLNLKMQIERF